MNTISSLSIFYIQNSRYLPNGSTTWTNNGGYQSADTEVFSVNGPVKDMIFKNNQLIVGGDFSQTAPNTSNTNHQLNANGMAYWNSDTWTQSIQCCLTKVNTMLKYKDTIFVAGHIDDTYSVAMFENGNWTDLNPYGLFSAWNDGYFTHFLRFYNRVFLIGNFQYSPGWSYFGNSIVQLNPFPQGFQMPDQPITAAVRFRDKIYFGGEFSTIGNSSLNQLAASYLGGTPSNTYQLANQNIAKVFQYEEYVVIEQNQASLSNTFVLYDRTGKVVLEKALEEGFSRIKIPTSNLSKGVYFYQLYNEEARQTGKLGVF